MVLHQAALNSATNFTYAARAAQQDQEKLIAMVCATRAIAINRERGTPPALPNFMVSTGWGTHPCKDRQAGQGGTLVLGG